MKSLQLKCDKERDIQSPTTTVRTFELFREEREEKNMEEKITIEQLLERLETKGFKNSCFASLAALSQVWYQDMQHEPYYNKLCGVIWTLYAFSFISGEERKILLESLLCKYLGSLPYQYRYDDNGNEYWFDEDGKKHYTKFEG